MAERRSSLPTTDYRLPTTRPILGYEPLFDTQAYRALLDRKSSLSTEEFKRRQIQLDTRTRRNLETALGERFNVELSQVIYRIENNQLVSDEHDEPFLEIIKRGQQYRKENGSGDIGREMAEVTGFERILQILTDPDFADAKIIVISPRGSQNSIYQHNFFDLYQSQKTQNAQNEAGPRSVVMMTRYASNATYEEFRQATEQIDPFNSLPQDPTDADFLKTPLITYQESAGIAKIMHRDEKTMTRKDLQRLIAKVTPLIDAYINEPSPKTYNAILNFADAIIFAGHETDKHKLQFLQSPALTSTEGLIRLYGNLPVRMVAAGCGPQGGFGQSATLALVNSPFSVSEFGVKTTSVEDEYGTLEIHCEECGATYNRSSGKLEEKCRRCGGTRGITC